MKQSPCRKAECLTCNQPGTGTRQNPDLSPDLDQPGNGTRRIQNLSIDLEATSPPKKPTKPTASPYHIISNISTQLHQVSLDNNLEHIQTLLYLFDLYVKITQEPSISEDFQEDIWEIYTVKYDLTELLNTLQTVLELTTTQTQPFEGGGTMGGVAFPPSPFPAG